LFQKITRKKKEKDPPSFFFQQEEHLTFYDCTVSIGFALVCFVVVDKKNVF
jgi:hypothetical protein